MIKKYKKFLEAFIPKDKESAIEKIVLHIKNKTGVDLNPYDEVYHIQKGEVFLSGQLFLSVKSNKSIRINWIKDGLRNEIHSIDVWMDFEFDKNPDYTLDLNGNSVINSIQQIVEFFISPKKYVDKELLVLQEYFDGGERLKDLENKLKRARSPQRKELLRTQIERTKASIAPKENRDLASDKIKTDDLNFDVFKAIELYTIQVAKGRSNSLIVSGMSGIGKTQVVKETLKSIGLTPDVNYYFATGTVTTAGLYEVLFKNRNSLIIFDDCDSVFKDPDSINMLKGALDTYKIREISKLTKGNTFDSTGMSDDDIETNYQHSQKVPNKFEFRGQIIFISNLSEEKFDDAILSRSLHVDVHLSKEEVVERMREIMKKINPELELELKSEALEYLIFITENHPVKFDLNIRTLIHSINLRNGNDGEMTIGGKSEKVWKLLIKKYLVKTKKY